MKEYDVLCTRKQFHVDDVRVRCEKRRLGVEAGEGKRAVSGFERCAEQFRDC